MESPFNFLKILVTTFTFLPNKDGVSLASAALAKHLAEKGHQVSVVTSEVKNQPLNSIFQNVRVFRFRIHQFPVPGSGSEEIDRYYKFLHSHDFDIIINQNWNSWTTEAYLQIARHLRAKSILVSHGLSTHMPSFHPRPCWGLGSWFRGVIWTAVNLPRLIKVHDFFVFNLNYWDLGRFMDVLICKLFVPWRTRFICNISCDCQLPLPLPVSSRQKHDRNRLVSICVANFCDRKNQLQALKVFAALPIRGASLVLIGSEQNDYSRRVSREIKDLHNKLRAWDKRVQILTGLSRKKVFRSISNADIAVLTSKIETTPIFLIEAMCFQKPWVAISSGSISQMKGGFACRSKRLLGKAWKNLFESKALRTHLGKVGHRTYLKNYSPGVFYQGWDRLMLEIKDLYK